MSLTRRNLLRAAAVAGGAAALGLRGPGSLAAEAVAGTALRTGTTRQAVLLRGAPGPSGWRPVVRGDGEAHLVRTDLGIDAKNGRRTRRKPLLAFAHLSDVHVCDAQSPMRLEFGEEVSSSAYRPQEILTAHIADSMVRRINEIGRGPVTGKPLALAIQTGDNSDTGQYNEIRWNIDVLDGAEVRPDSGDLSRYEGVMDGEPAFYDAERYWHPEGTPAGLLDDRPRREFGFPTIPGLLDAARAPFQATGLTIPWYTAMGNHDGLVQGNWPARSTSPDYRAMAVGSVKKTSKGDRQVTPDPDRRLLARSEWVEEHFTTTGTPVGHGFREQNRTYGTAYYHFDQGAVRFIVLDSVNQNGFQNGSLDRQQFRWLKGVLDNTHQRLVVVASHHTVDTMDNQVVTDIDPQPRILGDQVVTELLRHETVVAWVNGHTHTNHVWAHRRKSGGGFWEINTASHVDWPQQSRLIELADNRDGTVSIFATMVDHEAPTEFDGSLDDAVQLAALGRLLAANDWQEQETDRRGRRKDRNVELLVSAPAFLR